MATTTEPLLAPETKPVVKPGSEGQPKPSRWKRLLVPSYADFLFGALIVWLFLAGSSGWELLLVDGDAGWHIRTGEYVLDTGIVPTTDLYSFSKPRGEWYAWEWLADIIYASAHRALGMKGVVLLGGVLVALFGTLLIRYMVWKGANALLALGIGLLAFGASSLHFLARPHLFTLVALVGVLWIVERDRRCPSPALWLLIPWTAVWVNLHGGFVVLFPILGLLVVGSAVEAMLSGGGPGRWRPVFRYSGLGLGCAAASLLNPFGIELHRHIFTYLRAGWIRDVVQEFKAPTFRSESHFQFEILMFLALLAAFSLLGRRRVVEPLWIVLWAHLALTSARHITIFAIVAAPLVAGEATRLWASVAARVSRRSSIAVLDKFAADIVPGLSRASAWPVLFVVALLLSGPAAGWPLDFPATDFPIAMIDRHQERFPTARVFSNDEWADYLLYRFYPAQRVFFDGRSDYYGENLLREFMSAYNGRRDWEQILDRYACDLVLTPPDCALTSLLRRNSRWALVDEDHQAVLFVRNR